MQLYKTIVDTMTRRIEDGTFVNGERLPSVRQLSSQNGVSVATALHVYVTLERRGLVEARPRSGFFVIPRLRSRGTHASPIAPAPSQTPMSMEGLSEQICELSGVSDIVPLGAATTGAELLPVASLNRTMATVVKRAGAKAIGYSSSTGAAELRRQLAKRSFHWNCDLTADDFIVTTGTMEALSLCLRATAKPGDVVLVESPAYFGALHALKLLGLEAMEMPTHPQNGLAIENVERLIHQRKVAAVLTIPSFNNPLGSCMPEAHRERLVEVLARREIPLIEDDIYGDLAFPPAGRPRTIKSFDRQDLVLLCGSISTTLAPGWRVGWVAPGKRYYATIKQLKAGSTHASANAPQLALAEFLRDGGYDRHLRRLRRRYAQQIRRMTLAITNAFPSGIRISQPKGGLMLWIELPKGVSALDVYTHALAERISIVPGPLFSVNGKLFDNFIRVNCGHPWSEQIERAVATLGRIVHLLGTVQSPHVLSKVASRRLAKADGKLGQ